MTKFLIEIGVLVGLGIGLLIGWYAFPERVIVKECPQKSYNSPNRDSAEACINYGGIPKVSQLNGGYKGCDFPPK